MHRRNRIKLYPNQPSQQPLLYMLLAICIIVMLVGMGLILGNISFQASPLTLVFPNSTQQIPEIVRPKTIELPNVSQANSPEFENIYHNGRPFGRREQQQAMEQGLLDDLEEEYPDIPRSSWKKVERLYEYTDEHGDTYEVDLHWFEADGNIERGKVDSWQVLE
ncbi:hypothetical protein QUF63_13600 [Anaerolineales bacterium HSG25]|nr:hypothetical protein [Anaerolineales bacterium HSG25]